MPSRTNVVVFSGVFSLFKLILLIHNSLVNKEPIDMNITEAPAQPQILPEKVPVNTCLREPPIWSSSRWTQTHWMLPMTMASSNKSVSLDDPLVSTSPQDNARQLDKATDGNLTTGEEQIIPEKIRPDNCSRSNKSSHLEDLFVYASIKNDTLKFEDTKGRLMSAEEQILPDLRPWETSARNSTDNVPATLMTPVTEIAGTETVSLDDVDVQEWLDFNSLEDDEEEELVEITWESIIGVVFIILDVYWIGSCFTKWIKSLEKISTKRKSNSKKRKSRRNIC